MYDTFKERVEATANALFERWKKEITDWKREEQEAILEEQRENEEIKRELDKNQPSEEELLRLKELIKQNKKAKK